MHKVGNKLKMIYIILKSIKINASVVNIYQIQNSINELLTQ